MNLNWSNTVIKYVLFAFNFLFVISGIIMIAVGVSAKTYYTQYDVFLDDKYFSLPNLLIATGSLIFFISLLGCCGAYKESWFMIFCFSVLLILIFILEFSAGIAGYVLRDKTSDYLRTTLLAKIPEYHADNKSNSNDPTTKMWDTIQYEFQCCGANGPRDWKDNNYNKGSGKASNLLEALQLVKDGEEADPSTPHTTNATTAAPSTPHPTNATTAAKEPETNATTPTPSKPILLPASCCRGHYGIVGDMKCIFNDTETSTYYTTGCVDGFGNFLKDHAVTIGGVGLAIGFIQLFGVVFACHLAKQIKHGFYST